MSGASESSLASWTWLERLVGFNTVSSLSNLELIECCKEFLDGLHFECNVFYNEERTKANLYASIGPQDKAGIILSGHTDVVPVAGQDWETNPFTLTKKDDRIYGRGTCDMKGFIAVCLTFAHRFASTDLTYPIHLAFSYDEEVGCIGVLDLVDFIDKLSIKPFACFVGEPTNMAVVRKHKGIYVFQVSVTGFECHSSLIHQGVNAVEYGAELISKLRSMKMKKVKEGPFDEIFTPNYTSVHCGVVRGGEANNIVPKHCDITFEWRFVPSEDTVALLQEVMDTIKELEKEMKEVVPNSGFKVETIAHCEALDTKSDSDVVGLAENFSQTSGSFGVSYGTEAGIFSNIGIPTVVIGPGSIEQAHKPNEYVEICEMQKCEQFMERLLIHASSTRSV